MRKDFYVFRHGETELNRQKRWQGSGMDYDLNETGIKQAEELLEKLASDMENSLDFFSQEQDDLTNLIFGDAKRFAFDSTGRIVLTEKLLKHAEITDTAVFVGKGRKFQIWNPENWAKEEARIRAEVLKKRPSLKLPAGAQA